MTNKTPIMVLTGLGIVAAAAVAGLTRDHWMAEKPAVVATAPEAAKTPEPPAAATPEAPKTEEQPASTAAPAQQQATAPAAEAEQPATAATATQSGENAAAVQPESQTEQPAAANAAPEVKVPTFDTVRVEKTGEAVIAGTAEAGAEVVVMLDGKEIGQTTANTDGAFVVVPDKPLPAGSGALTIEAKGKDDASPTPSEQSVAVIVPAADQPQEALVAVVSPDQPTKVLQKPEVKAETAAQPEQPAVAAQPESQAEPAAKPAKLVSIDAVDYDPAGNIVFSGQGEKGNTARVYIDNTFIGDAPVGADGRWSFSGTADVAPGVHTLRVDGLDSAGKVLNRVEVPFFREEQSKVADASQPAQPAAEPATTATEPAAETTTTATEPAAEATTTAAQPAAETTTTAAQPAAEPATTTEAQPEAAPAAQEPAASGQQPATSSTAASEPAATPAKPKEGRVVIQPGNNLWRISRVLYGSGTKYTTLYEANKDQIRNPNRIYPGQVFKTPDVAATSETIDPKRREPLQPGENAAAGQ